MEEFETKTIKTTANHQDCGENTFITPLSSKAQYTGTNQFLEYINFIDPVTQFTTEGSNIDRSMPFLDTLVTRTRQHPTHNLKKA